MHLNLIATLSIDRLQKKKKLIFFLKQLFYVERNFRIPGKH